MKFAIPKIPKVRENKTPEPTGVIPASLVASAKLASWIAYGCLVYFLLLYTFDIAKDRAAPMHLTHAGLWVAKDEGLMVWFPYVVGFFLVAVGIPYVAKIAIPTFMSLDWRTNAWPKAWSLFIAMSVSLVVFAGTFTIQGDAILEKGREAAVEVAKVQQSNAVLQAQISAKEAELKSMMENRNAYLAQAASVGASEWQRSYISQTPIADPQRDRIVRALGSARAADNIRSEIAELRVKVAQSTTVAAVSERVEARAGVSWIGSAIDWIQGARAILLSLVMDIVALLMPWIALRLEQARARQMGEAPEDALPIMIEDHSAEAVPAAQPYTQATEKREQFFDEDGNKIVRRKATWAKVPTKKSGRKIVDPKTGKKVDDTTEYELAPSPDKVHLNEVYEDEQISSVVGEAHVDDLRGDADRGADDSSGDEQSLTPEPEEKADASGEEVLLDEQVREDSSDERVASESDEERVAATVAEPAAPEVALTQAIDDDRLDELVAKGVASEDEEGFVTFHSQEDQPVIEQEADVVNLPQLPAPKRETEEAA